GERAGRLGAGGGPVGGGGGGALQLLEIGDERIGGAGHPLRGVADVGRALGRGGGGLIGGGRGGRGLGGLAAQRLRPLGHLRETGAELLVRCGVRPVRGRLVDLVGVVAHALLAVRGALRGGVGGVRGVLDVGVERADLLLDRARAVLQGACVLRAVDRGLVEVLGGPVQVGGGLLERVRGVGDGPGGRDRVGEAVGELRGELLE